MGMKKIERHKVRAGGNGFDRVAGVRIGPLQVHAHSHRADSGEPTPRRVSDRTVQLRAGGEIRLPGAEMGHGQCSALTIV
jgi:hypothetical protein